MSTVRTTVTMQRNSTVRVRQEAVCAGAQHQRDQSRDGKAHAPDGHEMAAPHVYRRHAYPCGGGSADALPQPGKGEAGGGAPGAAV